MPTAGAAGVEAATAEAVAVSAVAVSTVVVVSMGEVSVAVVVSTAEASGVALSTEVVVVSVGDVSPVVVSMAVAFVGAVSVAATGVATGAITDSLMMSSSATSAFRGGGAGAIRTDITVPTIIRTITIGTAGTVTKATPAVDTAMAADQAIFGVCGGGDKRARDGV